MNNDQFKRALALAESGDVTYLRYEGERPIIDLDKFDGFGLPGFKPVFCTIAEVAALILYQGMQLNGEFDQKALQTVRHFSKTKFEIHGDPIADAKVMKQEARARLEIEAAENRRLEEERLREIANRPVRRRLTQIIENLEF